MHFVIRQRPHRVLITQPLSAHAEGFRGQEERGCGQAAYGVLLRIVYFGYRSPSLKYILAIAKRAQAPVDIAAGEL